MTDKIKPLVLDGDYKSRVCKLTLRHATYHYAYTKRETDPFDLWLEDDMMSAGRTITREELEAIRDWCNEALAVAKSEAA